MEVSGDSSSLQVVSPRHVVALFMETAVLETMLHAHNSLCYLLGSLVNRTGLSEHAGGNNPGIEGTILLTKKAVTQMGSMCQPHSDVPPESKDDGDSDNDDDEDDDEDGDEQDDDGEGEEDDDSGDEDNNPGDEDAEDGVEANGEGGSDDEDDEDDDEDEDDEDDDDEDGEDEDDEDEEDEEEDLPEPPTKKRK